MLLEIGGEDKVDEWIEEQLAQKKKIMGIGHRVYKVLDPRAPHLRTMAVKLSEELGEPKWIRMSERIAEIMKRKKGLNANVDFYSATVYYSLGIPTDMFTPILPSREPADGLLTCSNSSPITGSIVTGAYVGPPAREEVCPDRRTLARLPSGRPSRRNFRFRLGVWSPGVRLDL